MTGKCGTWESIAGPTMLTHSIRFPVNVFPPAEIDDPVFNGDWIYDGYGNLLADFLTPEALESFQTNGFYSIRPAEGLKLISINNNFGTV